MKGGRSILHNENMNELEQQLPATFVRVQRSYIANTSLIESLERKKSGVGELRLPEQITIPVSRRVMPSVREKLIHERSA